MKKSLIAMTLILASGMAFGGQVAVNASTAKPVKGSALSLPGYFGSINNNTGYVLECSQVIGGYCANNPMPANGYIQMLPDPGSKSIRGHVMAFDKDVLGKYADNLIFTYTETKNGLWKFQMQSLDKHVKVSVLSQYTVVLSRGSAK